MLQNIVIIIVNSREKETKFGKFEAHVLSIMLM